MEGSDPLRNPNSFNSPMLHSKERTDLNPRRRKRKKRFADGNVSSQDSDSCHSSNQGYPNTNPSTSHSIGFLPASSIPASTYAYDFNQVPVNFMPAAESFGQQQFEPSIKRNKLFNPFNFSDWKPMIKKTKSSPQKNNLMNYKFIKTSPAKEERPKEEEEEDVVFVEEVKASTIARNLLGSASTSQKPTQNEGQKSNMVTRQDHDPYGLLGLGDPNEWQFDSDSSSSAESSTDTLSALPEHILENVFALLPLTDLLLNVVLVCSRFREVIQNPTFLQWKKLYHRLKAKDENANQTLANLSRSQGMAEIEDVLPCLPRCLLNFCSSAKHEFNMNLLRHLSRHQDYAAAKIFLKENSANSFITNSEDPHPWCLVAALVVLSQNVADVSRIVQLLSRSACSILEAVEALYCLAAYLFHESCRHEALFGPHYRVFYALYLFENEWSAKVSDLKGVFHKSGQQNILKYSEGESSIKLTHEQMRIVHHPLNPKQTVKIVAFAGTGKTSTLIHFARLRQGMRFLLVVYNKAAQVKASREFPPNVECRTVSSLAYSGPGKRLHRKLIASIKPYFILKHLEEKVKVDRYTYARLVLNALNRYMSSVDETLNMSHACRVDEEVEISEDIAKAIVLDGQRLWNKMIDPGIWEVKALHDTYLKLYQLEKPVWTDYDCILVDEAQDCNPAMLDIILRQQCPKLLVGDPNQQIYSFRGAINALEAVQSSHTYYLTQSFRFGPEIAYVAHCTLAALKKFYHKTLVGSKQESHVDGTAKGQLAIIARCNITLFNEAVRLICKKTVRSHEPDSDKVLGCFIGGIKNYNLHQLVDIYNLQSRTGEIKDKFIQKFSTFGDLKRYADKAKDVDLQGRVKLVMQHQAAITDYVTIISERCRYDEKLANVVFTTAHKSKGLEFDTVCLTEDYNIDLDQFTTSPSTGEIDLTNEYNVLYVALTRAKKCLLMSNVLHDVLMLAKERFEVPVLLSSEATACVLCQEIISQGDKSFVLFRKPLRKMSGVACIAGHQCTKCASPHDQPGSKDKARLALMKILGTKPILDEFELFDFHQDIIHIILDPYNPFL